MGSINATIFAQKVSGALRARKIVNKRKLALESGYAPSVADKPSMITATNSYKVAFALEQKKIVEEMDKEIVRIQTAIASKNLRKEEYKTLVSSLDTLIKNKQLLSGNATSNIAMNIAISEKVAGKYDNIPSDVPSDKTENGST